MAAPLLHDERALGVLSVLDRPEQSLFSLQEMELLGLFANQAAIAVDLLLRHDAPSGSWTRTETNSESSLGWRLPWTRSRRETRGWAAAPPRALGHSRRGALTRNQRPGRLHIPSGPRKSSIRWLSPGWSRLGSSHLGSSPWARASRAHTHRMRLHFVLVIVGAW